MRGTNRTGTGAERHTTSGPGRRRGAWLSPVQRSPESPRPELLPRSQTPAPGPRGHRRPPLGGGERSRGSALRASRLGQSGPAPVPGHGPALIPAPHPIPIPVLASGPALALFSKSVPTPVWVPANAKVRVPIEGPPPVPVLVPGLALIPASALVSPSVTNSSPAFAPTPFPGFA